MAESEKQKDCVSREGKEGRQGRRTKKERAGRAGVHQKKNESDRERSKSPLQEQHALHKRRHWYPCPGRKRKREDKINKEVCQMVPGFIGKDVKVIIGQRGSIVGIRRDVTKTYPGREDGKEGALVKAYGVQMSRTVSWGWGVGNTTNEKIGLGIANSLSIKGNELWRGAAGTRSPQWGMDGVYFGGLVMKRGVGDNVRLRHGPEKERNLSKGNLSGMAAVVVRKARKARA